MPLNQPINPNARVTFQVSSNPKKKMQATFHFPDGKMKTTHFGAKGYQDYTIHRDPNRKWRYIQRHQTNENWSNPHSPGSLSRYILWEHTTIKKAIREYKKRFNFK